MTLAFSTASGSSCLRRLWVVLFAAIALIPGPRMAQAQDLPVAGDGKNVWVVGTDPTAGVTILHRQTDDEPNRLQIAMEVSGLAEDAGIAAADDRLYIIFSDHTIHSYGVNTDALAYLRYESPARVEPSLPDGVKVLSFVAGNNGLYVLVSAERPDVLATLDGLVPVTTRPIGLLPDESDGFAPSQTMPAQTMPSLTQPATQTTQILVEASGMVTFSATTPVAAPGSVRLLKLHRGDWVNVPLPPEIVAQFPVLAKPSNLERTTVGHLVRPRIGQKDPSLLVWTPNGNDTVATLWTLEAGTWKSTSKNLDGVFTAKPVVVEGQIIISRAVPANALAVANTATTSPTTAPTTGPGGPGKYDLFMYVLRADGVFPVGRIGLSDPSDDGWALIPVETNLALVEKGPKDTLLWTTLSIAPSGTRPTDTGADTGVANVMKPTAPLVLKQYNTLTDGASLLLQVGTFLFSIAVAAVVWRRNPSASPPVLPADLVPADVLRRAAAFSIDFIPVLLIVSQICKIDAFDLITNLFRQHASWEMIRPAAAVVLTYVGHTGISEIITGRSLGKMMMGLRVVNYLGQAPNAGQFVIRNLLKAFEIVGWPLLFLPVTLQFGQRLGDLAARTVVVMNKAEEDPDDDEEDFDDM